MPCRAVAAKDESPFLLCLRFSVFRCRFRFRLRFSSSFPFLDFVFVLLCYLLFACIVDTAVLFPSANFWAECAGCWVLGAGSWEVG